MTAKFVKNKVSRPFVVSAFDYYWDTGVDKMKDIMNVACDMGVIHRKGAYYFLGPNAEDSKNVYKDGQGNELKWQGKDALEQTLKASPALFDYINGIVQGRIPKDTQFVEENDIEGNPSNEEKITSLV